ncbi:transposase [Candidatus Bathyarchaeota archaeon]|nr:transposase [Candidatus Bathyarchaeota archaeon]
MDLKKEDMDLLNRAISYSITLEDQGTIPRYGWETVDRIVKPSYTSQTCPRCGHIGNGNWRGYSYFKCVRCEYEADRDRVASLNIAERATQVADPIKGQTPLENASVSGHVLRDERCGRWHQTTSSFKPTFFKRG